MKMLKVSTELLIFLLCFVPFSYGAFEQAPDRKKLLVVSSYHKEYKWTQETSQGFSEAMLKLGYFDNKEQIHDYTKNDYVETTHAVIKKVWMDTKRKNKGIKDASSRIYMISKEFKPDLIFVGDDNAANHIGNLFLDTETPVVFWGVNNTPVKYGLVDSQEKPGHNVTGVYQTGYYLESLQLLKKVAPEIKSFAILSDKTSSGRSHLKKIQFYAMQKALPLELVEAVSTDDYELWKKNALELQKSVDAFFIAQYSSLRDKNGKYVPTEEVTEWYLNNIRIPEAAVQGQFVKQGMLCSADDSGYNQGFEAAVMAHDILTNGVNPAHYSPRAPERGQLMVNRQRAEMLGIKLSAEMGIEEYIETASVLKR